MRHKLFTIFESLKIEKWRLFGQRIEVWTRAIYIHAYHRFCINISKCILKTGTWNTIRNTVWKNILILHEILYERIFQISTGYSIKKNSNAPWNSLWNNILLLKKFYDITFYYSIECSIKECSDTLENTLRTR